MDRLVSTSLPVRSCPPRNPHGESRVCEDPRSSPTPFSSVTTRTGSRPRTLMSECLRTTGFYLPSRTTVRERRTQSPPSDLRSHLKSGRGDEDPGRVGGTRPGNRNWGMGHTERRVTTTERVVSSRRSSRGVGLPPPVPVRPLREWGRKSWETSANGYKKLGRLKTEENYFPLLDRRVPSLTDLPCHRRGSCPTLRSSTDVPGEESEVRKDWDLCDFKSWGGTVVDSFLNRR